MPTSQLEGCFAAALSAAIALFCSSSRAAVRTLATLTFTLWWNLDSRNLGGGGGELEHQAWIRALKHVLQMGFRTSGGMQPQNEAAERPAKDSEDH